MELEYLHSKISLAIIRSQSGSEIGKASPHESAKKNKKNYIELSIWIKLYCHAKEFTSYVRKGMSNSIYAAIMSYILFDFNIIIIRCCNVKLKGFRQKDGQSSSSTAINSETNIRNMNPNL